jgi:hypothetical protein
VNLLELSGRKRESLRDNFNESETNIKRLNTGNFYRSINKFKNQHKDNPVKDENVCLVANPHKIGILNTWKN